MGEDFKRGVNMKQLAEGILFALFGVIVFNLGIQVGIDHQPEFDNRKHVELRCASIVPSEVGLRCIVPMQAEDDNLRIFREI